MEENQKFDVDQAMDRIEEINRKMAGGQVSLQESLDLYKEGTELAAKVKEELSFVEKQLIEIGEDGEES
ncbi:MAG: exodeoxyribonuclease VII small subunit [Lachnospiraceae bacterium]|nr:exodeoxyribonuclease VII small subunit [Lachnospiraceae bacterium]